MRCSIVSALIVSVFMLGSVAVAQYPPDRISRTYVFKPKPGHTLDFEKAANEHLQWVGQQNGKWSWMAFGITTGERVGSYLYVSPDHTWEDFDDVQEFATKATANWLASVSPFVESADGGIYRFLDAHSREGSGDEPSMATISTLYVRHGGMQAFLAKLGELTSAMHQQESAPPVQWYQLINGGEPRIVIVTPLKRWADMPKGRAAFLAMMKEMGEEKVAAIINELAKHIDRERSEIVVFRPDLSYRAQ